MQWMLFIVSLVWIMRSCLSYSKELYLAKHSYFYTISILLSSVIIVEILSVSKIQYPYFKEIAVGLICFININTYYLYEKIYESYKKNMEAKLLEQRVEMYQNQFEILNQSNQIKK